jgi:hypothetical protein
VQTPGRSSNAVAPPEERDVLPGERSTAVAPDPGDPDRTRELVVEDPIGAVYRVRAVRRGMSLRGEADPGAGSPDGSGVLDHLSSAVRSAAVAAVSDGRPAWKIGVFREGLGGALHLVHKEALEPGLDPDERMAVLRAEIAEGEAPPVG